jgi:hypothetical protein
MFSAYERIAAKRSWLVPGFVVWGLPSWEEATFLAVERVGSTDSVLYGSVEIGEASQAVTFSSLIDHRGNHLPNTLSKPAVMIRPRSETSVFVVEQESNSGFKIARDASAVDPAVVDLFVIEMGE